MSLTGNKSLYNFVCSGIAVLFAMLLAACTTPQATQESKPTMQHEEHQHHQLAGMDHSQHNMHGPVPEAKRKMYAGKENGVTQTSRDGHYNFTLYSTMAPIPFRKIHDWILHIETKDGQPVEDARVYVFGGMPMHQHGFPTKPQVKEYLGNGDYRVEGIKFNMPGHWEMRFNIKHKDKKDRVVYELHLGY